MRLLDLVVDHPAWLGMSTIRSQRRTETLTRQVAHLMRQRVPDPLYINPVNFARSLNTTSNRQRTVAIHHLRRQLDFSSLGPRLVPAVELARDSTTKCRYEIRSPVKASPPRCARQPIVPLDLYLPQRREPVVERNLSLDFTLQQQQQKISSAIHTLLR